MKFGSEKTLTPKVKKLVSVAEELFFHYGISRVSVEEICERANVSKMTFYRYFSNRSDVALYIMQKIYAEGRTLIYAVLEEDIPFPEKLKKVLLTKQSMTKSYSEEFLNDFLSSSDPVLREYLEMENERWFQELRAIFEDAQHRGELRQDINLNFIIYMFGVYRKIFEDPHVRRLYGNVNEMMNDAFTMIYYGILPREDER